MKFSFVVFALVASAAATVPGILRGLSHVSRAVKDFDRAISTFPNSGGTVEQLLEIHTSVVNLQKEMNEATVETKATRPFSQREANAILRAIRAIEPFFLHALRTVVTKKPGLLDVDTKGTVVMVKTDLFTLFDSNAALQGALVALAPDSIAGDGGPIIAALGKAFSQGFDAYKF